MNEYTTTQTSILAPDPLATLPDDERRILIAWRQARAASKNGTAALIAVKVFSEVLLFIGLPNGKVMLR